MLQKFSAILFYACCLSGVVVWLYAAYHWLQMFFNVRQGMRLFVFLTPVGWLFSSSFTEKGNYHRVRGFAGMLWFVLLCLVGALFFRLSDGVWT